MGTGTVRISDELIAKLKEEADKAGLTVADVADAWMRGKPVTTKVVELHPDDLCKDCREKIKERLLPGVTVKLDAVTAEKEPKQTSWWGVTAQEPDQGAGHKWGWAILALLLLAYQSTKS